MSDEKDKNNQNEEVVVSLEISTDNMEYRLIIRSVDGKALTERDFIVNVEMWLHEMEENAGILTDPSTQLH